jgi:hypothetical protein
MQPRSFLSLIALALALLLFAASCTAEGSSPPTSSTLVENDAVERDINGSSENRLQVAQEPSKDSYASRDLETERSSASDYSSEQENITVLEGDIFVSTTEILPELWGSTGWRIANKSWDTGEQDLPADCTLYPHSGAAGQWVGRCRGEVKIPAAGAANIAVMIAGPDGNLTMMQVAPPRGAYLP